MLEVEVQVFFGGGVLATPAFSYPPGASFFSFSSRANETQALPSHQSKAKVSGKALSGAGRCSQRGQDASSGLCG